jgi:Flp pilus assembly protein TadB
MALIDCPDCEKKISDLAPACPFCGRPMRAEAIPSSQPTRQAVMIEATGKKWKARQLVCLFIMLSCFVFGLFGAPMMALVVFLAGAAGLVWATVGAWWEHG